MNFSVNAKLAIADLNSLQTKALPYAIAKTLTRVAADSRQAVLDTMPINFRLRTGTAWLRTHFRYEQATAQTLTAYVFSDLDYMKLHEFTGIKTPRSGPHIAVPLFSLKLKKIPANLRPRYLLGKDLGGLLQAASLKTARARKRNLATANQGFILESGGKSFIAIRNGKQVTVLYVLVPAVKIGIDRLQMHETVARTVQRNFQPKFNEELAKTSLRFAATGG